MFSLHLKFRKLGIFKNLGKSEHWKWRKTNCLSYLRSLGWGNQKVRTTSHCQLFWRTLRSMRGDRSLGREKSGSGPSSLWVHWTKQEILTYFLFWKLRTLTVFEGHLTRWVMMSWWGKWRIVNPTDQLVGDFITSSDYNLSKVAMEGT